ncbi:hypothetical protein E2P81_ATG03524 [Venturia nashicola]|uniref:RlpA-like protein double-psi beta-barrel domain-containing protein n=1 Tax=Venturia nashicola TaxID=86259 RepID=A0A4Z1P922_9PEZI|nr:hypothetical protein E6O75_ATG03596 [Venturia nashicola]TLD37849.1 hypothetical protein E2P81_ATG03524 [Venturia nashicola]
MQFTLSNAAAILPGLAALGNAAPVDAAGEIQARTAIAQFSGDMTYYDPSVGMGSCGYKNGKDELVVAINHGDMANGANSNSNPHCGKYINIYDESGKSVQAKIVDTCPVCAPGAIDVTETVFKLVRPKGDGRVHNVQWDWATPAVKTKRGDSNTGTLTFDTAMGSSLGSCGFVGSAADFMVSVNAADMASSATPNPNNNPKCKRNVDVTWGGKTVRGYVSDICGGCNTGLDLTPAMFKALSGGSLDHPLEGAHWQLV